MTHLDYKGFGLDVPQGWDSFTTDNELVITSPPRPTFTPNLVVRVEPTTQTLAQLSDQSLRTFTEDFPTGTVVEIHADTLPGGIERRRWMAFTTITNERGFVTTVTMIRDLAIVDGLGLDISMTTLFQAGPEFWAELTDIADTARPAAAPQPSQPGEHEDVSWLYDVPLVLGPVAMRLSPEAMTAFEELKGSGRLFQPKADVGSAAGAELVRNELVTPDGALTDLGGEIAATMRKGKAWSVSYQTLEGNHELRGWRVGDANLIVVPPQGDIPAQLALTPATDAVRHIVAWSGTCAAWPAETKIEGLTPEQLAAKCLKDEPVPGGADAPLARLPWRSLTLTDAERAHGLSWIATPLGAMDAGSDPDTQRVWVATTPPERPMWSLITETWLDLTR